jgi:predicted ATPase/class 3 adenylate cyclase
MSELRHWLRRNRLEQLADAFEANDIDLDVLPELTEEDLDKLGVSLGNRRRFLKAMAERAGADAPGTLTGPAPSREAERRQVTVLFCDLVGSTELASAIDPEPLGALMRRYQDSAAGAIGRFGGFVAKFMGDGVLAYFGFPHAYEDAAERAVRAAIGARAAISEIERPDERRLQARIGIATGLVVIGEIVGTGTAQEHAIIGEAPNLAARLQSLATADTILISEATRQLVGNMFDLHAMGSHALKGFARTVPVWRVEREASIESRFAGNSTPGDLPLIGREHEMGLLRDRWCLARQGEGQIVTVIGEPGIGKSRSVETLRDRLAGEPHALIHLQCSPYHSDSALYPMIQHIARAARFTAVDGPAVRIEKLRNLFAARAASDPATIPLLAGLLSIPAPAGSLCLDLAQAKAATISLLVEEIVRLGETDPTFLVLEDAHWADATTLDLLTRLIDSIGAARLLVVVTARPEFTPPWLGRPHASLLTLGRMGRADCTELVTRVAQGLSMETVAAIVAKTDGVPLFAEELAKSVLETAGEDSAVPATLKDSLMARIDRLGEAREVAQVASVIGRQFARALLEALIPRRSAELDSALAKLAASGIVFPEGPNEAGGFSFKHALVRDAAYESLLLARWREWYAAVARALEERFPETAANDPELLAHHFAAAGLAERGCDYRMRAGEHAASRSAYKEAIAHFSAGLALGQTLSDSEDRHRRMLDFLLKLGPATMVVHGMQSAEAEEIYRRAADLGESLDSVGPLYKAKWGLWLNANVRRKTALARDRARELLALARRSNEDDLLLEAYHCGWATSFFRGEVRTALEFGRIGVESYDMSRHRHLAQAFGGHDPGVCGHITNALSLELASDRTGAQASIAQALALAEALDHPNSRAHALYDSAICYQLIGDRDRTFGSAQSVALLAEKFGLGVYRAAGVLLMAWATALGGGLKDSVRVFDSEIDTATATGPLPQYYLGLAGGVLLAAGRPADGRAYLDRAIATIDEPDVGFFLPEFIACEASAGSRSAATRTRRGAISLSRARSPSGRARSSSSVAPAHLLPNFVTVRPPDSGKVLRLNSVGPTSAHGTYPCSWTLLALTWLMVWKKQSKPAAHAFSTFPLTARTSTRSNKSLPS